MSEQPRRSRNPKTQRHRLRTSAGRQIELSVREFTDRTEAHLNAKPMGGSTADRVELLAWAGQILRKYDNDGLPFVLTVEGRSVTFTGYDRADGGCFSTTEHVVPGGPAPARRNWLPKVAELSRAAGPGILEVEILHDANCPTLRGEDACTCNPKVRVVGTENGPVH